MNTWEDDERLYRSAFDPNVQTAKEIESLRGQVEKTYTGNNGTSKRLSCS